MLIGEVDVGVRTQFKDDSGRFIQQVGVAAEEAAEEMADMGAAFAVVNIAQRLRSRTGDLLGSVDWKMVGPTVGEFYATAPHAAPLEGGATGHDIPNSFGWGPDYGFGEDRNPPAPFFHPGNPAFRFMRDAGAQTFQASRALVAALMPKG